MIDRDELLSLMGSMIETLSAKPATHVFVCHPDQRKVYHLPDKHEGFEVLTRRDFPRGEVALMEKRDLGLEWDEEVQQREQQRAEEVLF